MDNNKRNFLLYESETIKAFENLTEKQWNILKVALEVFTEKGYSAATTSEIARKAGVAEGTIFRHFKQKKDILLALLVPLLQNLIGPSAVNSLNQLILDNQEKTFKELLILILQDRYSLFIENQKLLRLIITESQYHPELKKTLLEGVIYKIQEFFIKLIDLKKRQGLIKGDVDSWTATRSLIGMLFLFIVSQAVFPEREQDKDTDKEIEAIVELFLQGTAI